MPEIEIIVRKSQGAEGVAQTEQAQAPSGEKPVNAKEKGKTDLTQKAVNGALIQVGKQFLQQGINQYSNLTGDYATSNTINMITTVAADIATIAAAGPAGAVYVAGKYALQIATAGIDQYRKNQEHSFNLQRLGQISIKGSRY